MSGPVIDPRDVLLEAGRQAVGRAFRTVIFMAGMGAVVASAVVIGCDFLATGAAWVVMKVERDDAGGGES